VAALRFNFRGVGRSAGVFDAGPGEREDFLAAIDFVSERFPDLPIWAAGTSSSRSRRSASSTRRSRSRKSSSRSKTRTICSKARPRWSAKRSRICWPTSTL
jgi:hypothetical protein